MTGTHSSHSPSGSHGDARDHEQHGGAGKFVMVFVALCVLTAISLIAGNSSSIMRNPAVGWTIMMAVSCAKATLLMLFPDIGRRTEKYTNERWLYAARPEVPHHDDEHAHDEQAHGAEESHKPESH